MVYARVHWRAVELLKEFTAAEFLMSKLQAWEFYSITR